MSPKIGNLLLQSDFFHLLTLYESFSLLELLFNSSADVAVHRWPEWSKIHLCCLFFVFLNWIFYVAKNEPFDQN